MNRSRALRLVLPLGILACSIGVSLRSSTSEDLPILGRYTARYAVFLVGVWVLAGVVSMVALSETRSQNLIRALKSPSFPLLGILACEVGYLSDFVVSLHFTLACVPYLLALAAWGFSSGERPSRLVSLSGRGLILQRMALMASSVLMCMALAELTFTLVLAKPLVPETQAQFDRAVASKWTAPVPAARSDERVIRILGLADSFGLYGGDRNYYHLLASGLAPKGYRVEVVNFSIDYLSPTDELALLKRFGAQYSPDLVLQGFYVGNDLPARDAPLPPGLDGRKRYRYKGVDAMSYGTGIHRLRPRGWLVVAWLRNRWTVLAEERKKKEEGTGSQDPNGYAYLFATGTFLRIQAREMELCRVPGQSGQPGWDRTMEILCETRRVAENMGADYALVLHPMEAQVEAPLRERMAKDLGIRWDEYDLALPQSFLKGACSSQGMACLDLLPALTAKGSEGGLYLWRDGHYSELGNQAALEEIVPFVEEKILVLQHDLLDPPGHVAQP